MLSIGNISSSAAAAKYHEQDDYYSEGDVKHQDLSQWFGQGAKTLGLRGNVAPEELKKILDGYLPDGTQLGRKNDEGVVIHAPGIDMTFSAPKSVSIIAHVAGDQKIVDLHQAAVKKALSYAEEHFVSTRIQVDGKLIKQQTPNIVAAIYLHDTSRNLDPQIHTHCVVANIVERGDGKWKSAFHGDIFDHKMLLGVIYRSELARELEKIGYTIDRTHQDGRFEITGVPQDLIDVYSTRSKEIKEALQSYDFKNAKTAADATLKTRKTKVLLERSDLDKIWNKVLEKSGHTKESLLKLTAANNQHHIGKEISTSTFHEEEPKSFLKEKWEKFISSIGFGKEISHINESQINKTSPKVIAKYSLDAAIEHLSERESIFEKKEILSTALSYGIGKISFETLEKTFDEYQKKEILLPAKDISLKNFYTTKAAIETELDTIKKMQYGKSKVMPLASSHEVKELLAKASLNNSQNKAAEVILTSKDQIIGVQGYAGTGKTFMLKTVKEIFESKGFKLKGMAPSASAAKTLQNDSGIESQTLHKFLFKYDGLIHGRGTKEGLKTMKNEMKNMVLVLDEGSLASTKHMNALFTVATKLDTRVIVVGDTKQLDAIEAGKPFYQLQKAGMKMAVMDQIIRQKDMDLKSAIEATIKGDIMMAFHRFSRGKNNLIIEEKSPKNIPVRAVQEYLKMPANLRDKTLILAPANETREAINHLIREELTKEGVLKEQEIALENLEQKDLKRPQKIDARNYSAGDMVLFNKDYRSLNIESGEYLVVKSVDQQKGIVWLEKRNGKLIGWDPEKVGGKRAGVVEVYEKKEIKLKEGEKIFWTKNSKKISSIINSGTAQVKKIEKDHILFLNEDGKEIALKKDQGELKHIDYGYSSTVYSGQGKTVDNVIAIAESQRSYLTSQKNFYVTISRARNKVTLIMDDKQKVAEKLHEFTGEKISALESQKIHEHHVVFNHQKDF